MKQGILVIWSFLLLLGLNACQKDTASNENALAEDGITLNLVTRANENVEAGEDRFNENLINRADVFFFDVNGTCLYSQIGVVPSGNKIKIKLDSFSEGDYYVYVIANGDFTYENAGIGKNLDYLKALKVTKAWNNNDQPEASLLMDGGKQVKVSKNGTETISLTRAMAKITLSVNAEEIDVNGVKYTPQFNDGMAVSMVNIVKSTNLGGTYNVDSSEDYITMNDRIIRNFKKNDEDGSYYHIPFYSFPNPEDTENREDAYLILRLPWKRNTDTGGSYDALDYYYQVPITGSDALALCNRNHYYKLNLTVGVLGSLNPQKPVTVTPDFIIKDWFTEELTADMQNYQYLVLDEYTSVMNNVNELRMPYVSSSAIESVDIIKVTCPDYSEESISYSIWGAREDGYNYKGEISSDYSVTFDSDALIFSHSVSNDDFVPYTITVRVTNNQGLSKEWTITQYPAIYIVAEKNDNGSSNRFVNGYYRSSQTPKDDYNNSLGSISSLGGAENENPNQYILNITSFDVDDKYIIGDSRNEEINNLSGLDLQAYKTTREDEESLNVISPRFMIASSWGVTTSISYETAKKRCASYQENGFPAGRWRVPTKAEVEFIISLSNLEQIPKLFNSGGKYWVSNGYYREGDGYYSNTSTSCFVRCVYDIWYWGQQKLNEISEFNNSDFVWGDANELRKGTKH